MLRHPQINTQNWPLVLQVCKVTLLLFSSDGKRWENGVKGEVFYFLKEKLLIGKWMACKQVVVVAGRGGRRGGRRRRGWWADEGRVGDRRYEEEEEEEPPQRLRTFNCSVVFYIVPVFKHEIYQKLAPSSSFIKNYILWFIKKISTEANKSKNWF